MKMASLQVSTPEGNSGRLFSDAEDLTKGTDKGDRFI